MFRHRGGRYPRLHLPHGVMRDLEAGSAPRAAARWRQQSRRRVGPRVPGESSSGTKRRSRAGRARRSRRHERRRRRRRRVQVRRRGARLRVPRRRALGPRSARRRNIHVGRRDQSPRQIVGTLERPHFLHDAGSMRDWARWVAAAACPGHQRPGRGRRHGLYRACTARALIYDGVLRALPAAPSYSGAIAINNRGQVGEAARAFAAIS